LKFGCECAMRDGAFEHAASDDSSSSNAA